MVGSRSWCNSIELRLTLLAIVWFRDWQVSNWCNINHLLLADWCRQWLNVNRMRRRFVTTSSFFGWQICVGYSRSFCMVFRCGHCKYLFVSTLGEYFLANLLNGCVLHGSSLHSFLGHSLRFLSTNILQDSVATRLRYVGFITGFATNLLLSLPVKDFWKSVSIWKS